VKKIIFLIISLVFLTFNLHAEDKTNKIAKTASDYISNLIPGEGTTEVSIDLRENYKPDFSILGVREIERNSNNNTFMQFSLSNTEKLNKERYVGNLGLGKRFLSEDNHTLTGINLFLDYDHYGNARGSIGGEIKNAVMGLTSNYYKKIDNGSVDEEVLDGYDIELSSQIPYLHWADIFYNNYKWDGDAREDIKGSKIGTEMLLTPSLTLEAAYDDKDKEGLEDEYYAKIIFVHPPRDGVTAQDGASNEMWKQEKDMSDEMLAKVKRNNKIMIEFKGSSTISRAD
tara:strand:- start:136 stop:990 length:855 start_codon:yes stop_codon:yes gene_type:complete